MLETPAASGRRGRRTPGLTPAPPPRLPCSRAMDADEEARIMEARRQRQARQAALEAERGEGAAAEEDEDRPPPRKGDPGFR